MAELIASDFGAAVALLVSCTTRTGMVGLMSLFTFLMSESGKGFLIDPVCLVSLSLGAPDHFPIHRRHDHINGTKEANMPCVATGGNVLLGIRASFPAVDGLYAQIMNSMSTRCRLEDRIFPIACFGLVVLLILIKLILGLRQYGFLDILEILIQLALAAGLFHLIALERLSLWTIVEVPSGIRMERDGTVLYEGPTRGIQIVDEDRAIMTLRSSEGYLFQFPRRRIFHKVLSQIEILKQTTGE